MCEFIKENLHIAIKTIISGSKKYYILNNAITRSIYCNFILPNYRSLIWLMDSIISISVSIVLAVNTR